MTPSPYLIASRTLQSEAPHHCTPESARLRAELGQLPADKLRGGLPELRKIGAENELARSLVTLAHLEAQAGHNDAALAANEEANSIFERLGTVVEQASLVLES